MNSWVGWPWKGGLLDADGESRSIEIDGLDAVQIAQHAEANDDDDGTCYKNKCQCSQPGVGDRGRDGKHSQKCNASDSDHKELALEEVIAQINDLIEKFQGESHLLFNRIGDALILKISSAQVNF